MVPTIQSHHKKHFRRFTHEKQRARCKPGEPGAAPEGNSMGPPVRRELVRGWLRRRGRWIGFLFAGARAKFGNASNDPRIFHRKGPHRIAAINNAIPIEIRDMRRDLPVNRMKCKRWPPKSHRQKNSASAPLPAPTRQATPIGRGLTPRSWIEISAWQNSRGEETSMVYGRVV